MWNLLLNEDETMITDSVREFLSSELPIERLRPQAAPTDVKRTHNNMVELGWFGVGLPESVGGTGLGLVEEMLIQRECGRNLVSPTVLATTLAAHVAVHANNLDVARDIITGKLSSALALLETPESDTKDPLAMALDWNGDDLLLLWNKNGMGLFDNTAVNTVATAECLEFTLTCIIQTHQFQ